MLAGGEPATVRESFRAARRLPVNWHMRPLQRQVPSRGFSRGRSFVTRALLPLAAVACRSTPTSPPVTNPPPAERQAPPSTYPPPGHLAAGGVAVPPPPRRRAGGGGGGLRARGAPGCP